MKNTKKLLALVGVIVLTAAIAIGGTLAYLTAQTGPVTNTFTVGKITATLDETDTDNSTPDKARDTANAYKIIPGTTIEKDPTIHVEAGSESCWVYFCINDQLNGTVAGSAKYTIDNKDWNKVTGYTNVYKYKEKVDVSAADATTKDLVIFNGLTIDGTVVNSTNMPSLQDKTIIINAYLHQSENLGQGFDVDAAAIAYFADKAVAVAN